MEAMLKNKLLIFEIVKSREYLKLLCFYLRGSMDYLLTFYGIHDYKDSKKTKDLFKGVCSKKLLYTLF